MLLYKTILSLILMTVFYGSISFAADSFPHGCEVKGFSFEKNLVMLNFDGNQSFYLIQNRSASPIELKRYEPKEAFMSPPLTAVLDPTNWAAFASDVGNLYFQCIVKDHETKMAINCSEALDVCQYPRVKFATSNMGNYWVSVNKTQSEVINESANKGILLRW